MNFFSKAALFITTIFFSTAFCEVRLCGTQTEDLILKPQNNPYIITGNIVIKSRTLWTIMPGVIIKVAGSQICSTGSQIDEEQDQHGMIAVIVEGRIDCSGKPNERIKILPLDSTSASVTWYGMVFLRDRGSYSKLAYTDISGALYGAKIKGASTVIRNCTFIKNQSALLCTDGTKSKVFNSLFTDNLSAAIIVKHSTPEIFNNLIMNNLNGVLGDGTTDFAMDYNCFWKNIRCLTESIHFQKARPSEWQN